MKCAECKKEFEPWDKLIQERCCDKSGEYASLYDNHKTYHIECYDKKVIREFLDEKFNGLIKTPTEEQRAMGIQPERAVYLKLRHIWKQLEDGE